MVNFTRPSSSAGGQTFFCQLSGPQCLPEGTFGAELEGHFKSFLLGSQDLKVNLCGLQQDIHSDGKSKKDCGNRRAIPTL